MLPPWIRLDVEPNATQLSITGQPGQDRPPVLIQGASGQTTDLIQLQDSTGTVVYSVGPTGTIRAPFLGPYDPETRPWYLDIFWLHFKGRGFDGAQGQANTTLASPASAGDLTLTVASATGYVVGEPIAVGSGITWQTFVINSIAGNGLTVFPKVQTGGFVSGSAVNHAWGNDTHPAFTNSYAAYAATVAGSLRKSVTGGLNRLGSIGDLSTSYTDARSVANVPTGWESLGTATFATTSYSTSAAQPNARAGNGVTITHAATSDGMRTLGSIPVVAGETLVAQAMMKAGSGSAVKIRVVDKNSPSTVVAEQAVGVGDPSTYNWGNLSSPDGVSFTVPAGVTDIEIRILATSGAATTTLDDVRLIATRQDPNANRYVIEDPGSSAIAWLGDSWGLGTTTAAGQFKTALEARLGHTITLINASVTGNTLADMVARFDTDVRPYAPLYCVVQYGANDISQGRSQSQMETDLDQIIDKCRSRGIIPVIAGLPPFGSQLATAAARNDQLRARVDRVVR